MPMPESSHTLSLNLLDQDINAQEVSDLAQLLFAHVPYQDVVAYSTTELHQATLLAKQALLTHKQGEHLIYVNYDWVTRGGVKISTITLVNDNRPFLLDSAMAEITENAGELYLVAHPVFDVGALSDDGWLDVSVSTASAEPACGKRRVSLIQFHVSALDKAHMDLLRQGLGQLLKQGEAAVRDWQPMLEHVSKISQHYRAHPLKGREIETKRIADFLDWLAQDNFIFLGLRGDGVDYGICQVEDVNAPSQDALIFADCEDLLLITKARRRSLVHRRAWLDAIRVKLVSEQGTESGEMQLVGLFASTAYTDSVLRIPTLAPKVEAVIHNLGFNPQDHSGRMLVDELEIYPRDEMFRIDVESLTRNIEQILALGERPRIRVLVNDEREGHFVTVLVFIPRDRYDSDIREKIGQFLLEAYGADFFEFFPLFLKNGLTRIRYTLHRQEAYEQGYDGKQVAQETLENTVAEIIRNWQDKVQIAALEKHIDAPIASLAASFPDAYRDVFDVEEALQDAVFIHDLSEQKPLHVMFYSERTHQSAGLSVEKTNDNKSERTHQSAGLSVEKTNDNKKLHEEAQKQAISLKLFHRGRALELSNRVPLLENMGFRVIAEQTFELPDGQGGFVYLHDMELENGRGAAVDLSEGVSGRFNQAFEAIWSGKSYNDAFNLLIHSAGLDWYQVVIIRTLGRYLQQAGVPYSQRVLAKALDKYPKLVQALYALFACKFDPAYEAKNTVQEEERLEAVIEAGLADVPSLEEDRILRHFRTLIHAALRTNAYLLQSQAEGGDNTIAIKFDSTKIDFLPRPVPYREIFVYGPQVQGVHLRFGPVARGGIRWSDRGQDYRTEVLGLVKAQQVKNSVIVPVGAKGGFFPHNLPRNGDRAQMAEVARQAYIAYVRAMLSITDNNVESKIVPPAAIVRHDGDDAYFVVAADKGTATFSDTANAISQSQNFWLDDAFASGGSAGYDHKGMGITARGAWEAVKRHFRELDHDIQSTSFTCVGVGDMSGDVFGNGMLLSNQTCLVAAFDHRDIFIDPDPDPALSHQERLRLFHLPRSSWQDYDRGRLSEGGGVFSRGLKMISLSPQARALLGISQEQATPAQIISAILRAPVDLLWFGGIGTYIRGTLESDMQVGDHANDAIRITGSEIRARVVGEGANLGMTQRGRIEYALKGGRCNTDAIDNSGGVNCSDVEVNIKIALAAAMLKGKLDRPERDALLMSMTDEVARLVLRNNYIQPQVLSLAEARGVRDLPYQIRFMHDLERRHLLDRHVEALPDDKVLAERQSRGQGLTRPELSILMAYAKIALSSELAVSPLVDDSYFDKMLVEYFPHAMRVPFAEEIATHPLRRDIIATLIANDVVNRGGLIFVSRLQDKTGGSLEAILRGYSVLRDGFDLKKLYEAIDALDNKISGKVQNTLMGAIARMLFRTTAWLVRNNDVNQPLEAQVSRIAAARKVLTGQIEALVSPSMRANMAKQAATYIEQGAPAELARQLSLLEAATILPDIMLLTAQGRVSLERTARCYFTLSEYMGINRLEEARHRIPVVDYYDGMALTQAGDQIAESLRKLVLHVLRHFGGEEAPEQKWLEALTLHMSTLVEQMRALTQGDVTLSRFIVAAGMMADLAREK